jgi:hypothetical protein
MPSPRVLPNFEDFYLNIGTFAWLHQSRWEQADCDFFLRNWQNNCLLLHTEPRIVHRRKEAKGRPAGSWILKDTAHEVALLGAELQLFHFSRYTQGFVFLGPLQDPRPESLFEALVALVSLVFIVGKPDQLRIVATSPDTRSLLDQIQDKVGDYQTLYGLPKQPWRPGITPLVPVQVLQLDRWAWQSTPDLPSQPHQLRHIEMRL